MRDLAWMVIPANFFLTLVCISYRYSRSTRPHEHHVSFDAPEGLDQQHDRKDVGVVIHKTHADDAHEQSHPTIRAAAIEDRFHQMRFFRDIRILPEITVSLLCVTRKNRAHEAGQSFGESCCEGF